jgi:hypothetical protein
MLEIYFCDEIIKGISHFKRETQKLSLSLSLFELRMRRIENASLVVQQLIVVIMVNISS